MTTTVPVYDLQCVQRTLRKNVRCLLAMLLYSCNPSAGPDEPSSPIPEPAKAHTTATQNAATNVAQRDSSASTIAQPEDTYGPLNAANTDVLSDHLTKVGGHCDVVSDKWQHLKETAQNNEGHTSTQHSEPHLDPQEILNAKLNNPKAKLIPSQSISLVNYCAKLGEQNATNVTSKEVLMVLGNAGVGKSTTVNYLMGCEMKAALDEFGEEIVVVSPESIRPEVMPIGHGKTSYTFMPQIVPDADNNNQAYCDCPGFSDNRGAEINIANAINTRRVLQQATGVKAVFLAEYSDLIGSRGSNIRAMEHMCHQMFGGIDNLRRHQNSVLLGITKAPLYNRSGQPISLNTIRLQITRANKPIAKILANRVFLFDPLDRGRDNPDFWSRERCLTEIERLSIIPRREAATLFQTVLTDSDQTKLKHIMRAQAVALVASLACDDYQIAERHWQALGQLKIIGSAEVEKMIQELAGLPLLNFVQRRVAAYKETALQHRFGEAERQLALLKTLLSHFPQEQLEFNVKSLETVLRDSKEKKRIDEECARNNVERAIREAARKAREEADRRLEEQAEQFEREIEAAKKKTGNGKCCTIS
jgi:energy-coupling factor transporter ATP-binding protein EcfA2